MESGLIQFPQNGEMCWAFSEHRNEQYGPQNANNILCYSYRLLFGGNTRKNLGKLSND